MPWLITEGYKRIRELKKNNEGTKNLAHRKFGGLKMIFWAKPNRQQRSLLPQKSGTYYRYIHENQIIKYYYRQKTL